jgi:transcriptional regulator with XRE-family HTH domain
MTEPNERDPHLQKIVRTAIGGRSSRTGAELAGVSRQTLRNAMNGKNIQVNTLRRIAEAGGYRMVITLEKPTN